MPPSPKFLIDKRINEQKYRLYKIEVTVFRDIRHYFVKTVFCVLCILSLRQAISLEVVASKSEQFRERQHMEYVLTVSAFFAIRARTHEQIRFLFVTKKCHDRQIFVPWYK